MKLPVPSYRAPENYLSLSPDFFLAPVEEVAQAILGKGLLVQKEEPLLVEITEVEAYSQDDAASHSFRGLTPRNWPMFETGGTAYVYLSYGMHYCLNVSTGPKGVGEALLFRAARPLAGLNTMRKNRTTRGVVPPDSLLLNGPGRLTQALGVTLNYNGVRFDRQDFRLVDLGQNVPRTSIARSPRIGITKGREALRRFFLRGSPWLSRKG